MGHGSSPTPPPLGDVSVTSAGLLRERGVTEGAFLLWKPTTGKRRNPMNRLLSPARLPFRHSGSGPGNIAGLLGVENQALLGSL